MERVTIKKMTFTDAMLMVSVVASMAFSDQNALVIALQVAFVLSSAYKIFREDIELSPYIVWQALFIGFSFLSYFWSVDTSGYLYFVMSLAKTAAFCGCVATYVSGNGRWRLFVVALLVSYFVLCARVVVFAPVSAWGADRVGTYIGYGNVSLARVLGNGAIITLFALMYLTKNAGRRKIALTALLFLILFVLVISGTRKGFITVAVGVVVLVMATNQNRRGTAISKILKLMVVMLSVYVAFYALMNVDFLYNAVGYRFEGLIDFMNDDGGDKSTIGRSMLYQMSLEAFSSSPLFGIGLDAFRYTNFYGLYAHSNYLEIAADLGLVGLLLYYGFLLLMIKKAIRLNKRESNPWVGLCLSLLIAILVTDLFDVNYFRDFSHLIYAFIAVTLCRFDAAKEEKGIRQNSSLL